MPATVNAPGRTATDAKRERYFTPAEVEVHSTMDDCWLSLLGKVYDVTALVQQHKGRANTQRKRASTLS